MTDSASETQPDPQPEQQPASPPPEPSAVSPSRSPVERAVVWGIIAVLVVIAVLEARARFAFKAAHDSLLDRIQQGEQTGKALAGPEVTDILKGRKPDETRKVRGLANGAVRVDIYHFRGILQKRTLYVYYGSGGVKGQAEVVAVTDREAEKYVPRTTGGSSGIVEPTGQPKDGIGEGSGQRQPAGEKTKGTPAPKKSKPVPKKSKSAPVKTKSTPPTKKSTTKKAPAAKNPKSSPTKSKAAPVKTKSTPPTKKKTKKK